MINFETLGLTSQRLASPLGHSVGERVILRKGWSTWSLRFRLNYRFGIWEGRDNQRFVYSLLLIRLGRSTRIRICSFGCFGSSLDHDSDAVCGGGRGAEEHALAPTFCCSVVLSFCRSVALSLSRSFDLSLSRLLSRSSNHYFFGFCGNEQAQATTLFFQLCLRDLVVTNKFFHIGARSTRTTT